MGLIVGGGFVGWMIVWGCVDERRRKRSDVVGVRFDFLCWLGRRVGVCGRCG